MTFKEIWAQLLRKNADLANADAKVEFTSANLEMLLRQVYEQGQKSVPKATWADAKNPFSSMFGL